MTNWDIVYFILAIVWVSLIVIGVIVESAHLLLERKELRELIKIKHELEKRKEKNNEETK